MPGSSDKEQELTI